MIVKYYSKYFVFVINRKGRTTYYQETGSKVSIENISKEGQQTKVFVFYFSGIVDGIVVFREQSAGYTTTNAMKEKLAGACKRAIEPQIIIFKAEHSLNPSMTCPITARPIGSDGYQGEVVLYATNNFILYR